jgi:hypothetical protein
VAVSEKVLLIFGPVEQLNFLNIKMYFLSGVHAVIFVMEILKDVLYVGALTLY